MNSDGFKVVINDYCDEIQRLKAENEKLREALELALRDLGKNDQIPE